MTDIDATEYTPTEQDKSAPVQSFHRSPKWPQERIDLVADLIRGGLTARQVATRLGGGLSRNAIIGICKRRGIPLNSRPGDNMKQAARERRERRPRRAKRMFPDLPVVPLPPRPATSLSPPTCQPVGLLELTNETCRWPLGEPVSGFCGAREADNRNSVVYCPYHSRIAYRRLGEVEA